MRAHASDHRCDTTHTLLESMDRGGVLETAAIECTAVALALQGPGCPLTAGRTPAKSTPANICSCAQDGVVIGADTRATAGSTIAIKNSWKLHSLAPNIVAGGAGTAADLGHVSRKTNAPLCCLFPCIGRIALHIWWGPLLHI